MAAVGDNIGVTREKFMENLAIALKDNQERDAVKARRSANRKHAKADGIDLGKMDEAIKMSEWSPSEIADHFAKQFAYLGYMSVDVGTQFDMFNGPQAQPKAPLDYYPAGLYAGIQGKPCEPPAELTGNDRQRWIAGWHEGQAFLARGLEKRAERSALTPPADPTNGVRDQAAADFKADNPEASGDGGEPDGDADGSGAQPVTGDNVIPFVQGAADGEQPKGDDFQELSPEELAKQAGRPAGRIMAKDTDGKEVEVDADDPLLVDGTLYPNITRARAARKRGSDTKPQSEQASEARAAAGVE